VVTPPPPVPYRPGPPRPGNVGWRASGWVTFAEWMLWLAWLIGTAACLFSSLWARITFLGDALTPVVLTDSRQWLLAAAWFGLGPSSAGLLLAILARRHGGVVMFAIALAFGLALAGAGWYGVDLHRLAHYLSSVRARLP
jgi:hypothetical protein